MSKDWIWNTQSVMATLNASSHSKEEREKNDYYATPPEATRKLLDLEKFKKHIWEPACWEGHISKELEKAWYTVHNTDLIDRGYWKQMDFLNNKYEYFSGDIITNPPFKYWQQFVEEAMRVLKEGWKLVMLLRIQFLEGVARNKMYKKFPPKKIYVFSRNIRCAKNWDFENATWNASTYCWFVWEKWYTWDPIIKWII